jgi:DNA helicase-2/ATP-dependent DNA helicase PcrA
VPANPTYLEQLNSRQHQTVEHGVLASHHSGPLEVKLTRRNIPFVKFGGLKFLNAAHVKDLLTMLRFVQNPRDRVAGFRLMQLLPGVGPTSAHRVLDRMHNAVDPIQALMEAPAPPRTGDGWHSFVNAIAQVRAGTEDGRPSLSRSGHGMSAPQTHP